MRLKTLVAATFLTAGAAASEDRKNSPGRDVVICMARISDIRVREATRIATRIFGDIGVRLDWRFAGNCPAAADAIQVGFSHDNSPLRPAGTLAYAYPFEGSRIVVLPDRVRAVRSHTSFHLIFAYVLVHEITHVLQGIARHSPEGIMKPQWTDQDYFEMMHLRLAFTTDDVDRIYDGLDSRFAKTQKSLSAGL
jgi:hypothetical protein